MSGKPIRIGARVKTPKGEGEVIEVMTWTDCVSQMTDHEAQEFTRRLLADLGRDYKAKYRRVLVMQGVRAEWHESPSDIEVLDDE